MFIFDDRACYDWPVTIWTPDGGDWRRGEFMAVFRPVSVSRMDSTEEDTIIDIVREAWVGWRGIANEAGLELAYSPEMRDRLLDHAPTRRAVIDAFLASIAPRPDGTRRARVVGLPAPSVAPVDAVGDATLSA